MEETSPAEVPEGPVTPPDASEVPAEGPPADLTVTPETESGTESPL